MIASDQTDLGRGQAMKNSELMTKAADVMIEQTQRMVGLLKRGESKKALAIAKELIPELHAVKQIAGL
jgi:hypothetical protein